MSEVMSSAPTVDIVTVQFHSKNSPDGFGGMQYTYKTAIPLEVGEIVVTPTKRGPGKGKVARIGLTEADLSPGIEYKTITEKDPDYDKMDTAVLEAWGRWEEIDTDISTDQLFARVESDTGYDADAISDTLYRRRRSTNDEGGNENV